jgi:hypothetical protein
MTVARDDVCAAFLEGVAAIEGYAARMSNADWESIACGDWTAAEVVAHVGVVAGWYHQWLDRAERGDASPAFPIEELSARNAEELRSLGPAEPATHVEAFVSSATAYASRLPAAWDLPFGYPRGTVTAGQHAALATVEWHTHAWDLAGVLGETHVPAHPGLVAAAAADTWLASGAGLRRSGAVRSVATRVAERQRDPWHAVLHRMGRV